MKSSEMTFLAALVGMMYGDCTFLRTATVRQIYEDRTIWSAQVAVFDLNVDGEASECFAWCNEDELGTPRPVVFVKTGEIDSPAAAVRAFAARELPALVA